MTGNKGRYLLKLKMEKETEREREGLHPSDSIALNPTAAKSTSESGTALQVWGGGSPPPPLGRAA